MTFRGLHRKGGALLKTRHPLCPPVRRLMLAEVDGADDRLAAVMRQWLPGSVPTAR